MKYHLFTIALLFLFSCKPKDTNKTVVTPKQPNVLWIVTEDISPTLSFYGDKTAKTPNLDRLANESLIYDNAFTTVGVCAPSRSSIITGMHPTSIGTIHMRTSHDVFSWGKRDYSAKIDIKDIAGNPIRKYAAVIPEYVKCYTEYLRAAGYFTTNNSKTDYQFAAPVTAWDQNSAKAHWRNTPKGKPFFSIFNIDVSHESYLWRNKNLPLTVNPDSVPVPPYLPDNKETRNTIARHYSNVELMDKRVGEIIKELKEDSLYNNTIIFFYSDHGGPLPRGKRAILDSGLKVPFMVKNINGEKGRTDRLISFVDLAPTMLSLAGVKPKDYMEGYAFMGKYDTTKREYVFGSSDRFDEFTDRIRSVRNKKYLYLRNSFPELPKYKDVAYRKNIPMMPTFLKLRDENKLNDVQKIWFGTKTKEELYDCKNDPFNLTNLADKPAYAQILEQMRTALDTFQKDKIDYGKIPEATLINQMWPNFKQPITENVTLTINKDIVTLSSATKGASIAYIISNNRDEKLDFNSGWQLYSEPITVKKGQTIYTIAQRIGFKESQILKETIE
ncbi:sulfatase-like hydrolase/transferase [Polaribacter batillariae]|uniref:Sulfatase-like hydrolase/transferase n=1 Tax=Polaribacter batillariae TaxID=2808900 RepID=A0ABX7SX89_9FLAO|nr:sulfatase-like hydrolase/transferase [Polaribacter batillariae]QTD38502.1 sulfatase-like hydrolase/transferase [Polaribacter batillariae]